MEQLIGHDLGAYTFDPAAGTIQLMLGDESALAPEQIRRIVNVTRGAVLWAIDDPQRGGTLTPGARPGTWTLTLAVATGDQSASDALSILVDCAAPRHDRRAAVPLTPDYNWDLNLAEVLGTQPLVQNARLRVSPASAVQARQYAALSAIGAQWAIACDAAQTVAMQLAGTWAGTVIFEASVDGGNFVAVAAAPLGGGALAQATTSNGAWVVNAAGISAVRLRMIAYASGAAQVTLVADTALIGSASGTQTVSFPTAQAVTESNLTGSIGSSALYAPADTDTPQPIVAPTVSPTQPTAYAAPKFAAYPQHYRRVRVEAGGSERQPLAQEPYSNRLLVATPELLARLEEMLWQMTLTNQLLAQAHELPLPFGQDLTARYNPR